MDVSKSERVLDLLALLLGTERPITASTIHERMSTLYPEDVASFKRQFERDKKELRDIGIPLLVEPAPGVFPAEDGYRIDPREYALSGIDLAPDELAAVHLAVTAIRLEGFHPEHGLRKLGGLIGEPTTGGAGAVLPGTEGVSEVFQAISEHRRLTFDYRGRPRRVDPWGLQHARGSWYLRGFDIDANDARSFRLDRCESPIELGPADSADPRPDGEGTEVRLGAWMLGEDEPVSATVHLRGPQAVLAERRLRDVAELAWNDADTLEVTLEVRRPEGLFAFLLGFLDDAELVEPPELRDAFVAHLRALAGAT